MAEEEMRDQGSPESGEDSSDASSDSEPIESLVTGRERRKTAGNRYDRDLVAEEVEDGEDPDEVALLFATEQDEVDEEFKSDGSDDDVMSSSDDDDQGPNAGAEDLEGENEIQRQAKAERARKRKADLALTSKAAIRKKPKIDPTQGPQPAVVKKPSKKKERVTWLPDENAEPGRVSQRKQTVAHREETLARLKESEALSKKFKALKEKRDREKAKNAPKAMTQADRLEEAARVERKNAKSLNRWEAMERKRNEEQAAKLAALKNRTLEGPVLTWRSTKSKWRGPLFPRPIVQDITFGNEISTEPKKRGRKPKGYHEQMAAMREAALNSTTTTPIGTGQGTPTILGLATAQQLQSEPAQPEQQVAPSAVQVSSDPPSEKPKPAASQQETTEVSNDHTTTLASTSNSNPVQDSQQAITQNDDTAMTDNHPPDAGQPPTKTEETSTTDDQPAAVEQTATQVKDTSMTEDQPADAELATTPHLDVSMTEDQPTNIGQSLLSEANSTSTTHNHTATESKPDDSQVSTAPPVSAAPQALPTLVQPVPEPPIVEGFTTKNLVILKNFDELANGARQDYGVFYNTRKSAKPIKHNLEQCPITMQPAKYRDPATGIGYSNAFAYKTLKELKEHKFVWSSMLGCYLGREGAPVARGVPDGFPGK